MMLCCLRAHSRAACLTALASARLSRRSMSGQLSGQQQELLQAANLQAQQLQQALSMPPGQMGDAGMLNSALMQAAAQAGLSRTLSAPAPGQQPQDPAAALQALLAAGSYPGSGQDMAQQQQLLAQLSCSLGAAQQAQVQQAAQQQAQHAAHQAAQRAAQQGQAQGQAQAQLDQALLQMQLGAMSPQQLAALQAQASGSQPQVIPGMRPGMLNPALMMQGQQGQVRRPAPAAGRCPAAAAPPTAPAAAAAGWG
jgi:hypothetical protein